jgi:hypothetical protein
MTWACAAKEMIQLQEAPRLGQEPRSLDRRAGHLAVALEGTGSQMSPRSSKTVSTTAEVRGRPSVTSRDWQRPGEVSVASVAG